MELAALESRGNWFNSEYRIVKLRERSVADLQLVAAVDIAEKTGLYATLPFLTQGAVSITKSRLPPLITTFFSSGEIPLSYLKDGAVISPLGSK